MRPSTARLHLPNPPTAAARLLLAASLCLAAASCARTAQSPDRAGPAQTDTNASTPPGPEPDGPAPEPAQEPDDAQGPTAPPPAADAGDQPAPSPPDCGEAATCEQLQAPSAVIDASDARSSHTEQGAGSAWLAFDATDGNMNATQTARIGVDAQLRSSGRYRLTLTGDTSPAGAGRCVAADVTDTDPLHKTAIWGSFGPAPASPRRLAVHIESLDGACEPWTLTLHGDPCPGLTIAIGEQPMGSCP